MTWDRINDKPNVFGKRENVCWTCKKSYGGCSWSDFFVPVKGWDAEKDLLRAGVKNKKTDTYKIRYCPEYVRGKAELKTYKNTDAYEKLLYAIARRAVNDLNSKDSEERKTARWFLESSEGVVRACKKKGLWYDNHKED